jgi:hypothetical protein
LIVIQIHKRGPEHIINSLEPIFLHFSRILPPFEDNTRDTALVRVRIEDETVDAAFFVSSEGDTDLPTSAGESIRETAVQLAVEALAELKSEAVAFYDDPMVRGQFFAVVRSYVFG